MLASSRVCLLRLLLQLWQYRIACLLFWFCCRDQYAVSRLASGVVPQQNLPVQINSR